MGSPAYRAKTGRRVVGMQDVPHLGRQDAPPLGILRNACARCRPRGHDPSLSQKMCLSLKLRLHLQLKLRPEQPIFVEVRPL